MVGTTISHYKVIEKIGQGGMGEVYRAEDTNLSREVAIKVLSEQFTQDPQRLARFEREAKLLASLNHPGVSRVSASSVTFLRRSPDVMITTIYADDETQRGEYDHEPKH